MKYRSGSSTDVTCYLSLPLVHASSCRRFDINKQGLQMAASQIAHQSCRLATQQTMPCAWLQKAHLSRAACRRLCLLRRMSALSAALLSRAAAALERHVRKALLCRAAALLAYTLNRMSRCSCCSCRASHAHQ